MFGQFLSLHNANAGFFAGVITKRGGAKAPTRPLRIKRGMVPAAMSVIPIFGAYGVAKVPVVDATVQIPSTTDTFSPFSPNARANNLIQYSLQVL